MSCIQIGTIIPERGFGEALAKAEAENIFPVSDASAKRCVEMSYLALQDECKHPEVKKVTNDGGRWSYNGPPQYETAFVDLGRTTYCDLIYSMDFDWLLTSQQKSRGLFITQRIVNCTEAKNRCKILFLDEKSVLSEDNDWIKQPGFSHVWTPLMKEMNPEINLCLILTILDPIANTTTVLGQIWSKQSVQDHVKMTKAKAAKERKQLRTRYGPDVKIKTKFVSKMVADTAPIQTPTESDKEFQTRQKHYKAFTSDQATRYACGFCWKADDSIKMCCGKCKSIRYCSQTCQKQHWSQHKLNCSAAPA